MFLWYDSFGIDGKEGLILKKCGVILFLVGLITAFQARGVLADGTASVDTLAAEAMSGTASAEQGPSIEGQWDGDGEDWRYMLPDGTLLEKSWLYDNGHWYYFDTSGWMVSGYRRIGSVYYYFREDGVMGTGWIYDADEDVWYFAEESGALITGWHSAGGAWYWFDSKRRMYRDGERMIDGHKYYFFENGQMAANQYVGVNYYGGDGLRDRRYDMTIKGDRKPDKEEKERITRAMDEIPREWILKFNETGWEIMFYTDKKYYSAPMTERGIYYVYYQTDTNYKKLKFTRPEQLAMAFGEYVAWATGNDKEDTAFLADYAQYLSESSLAQTLPSYFDDDLAMQFGNLLENYCDPEIRAEMKRCSPEFFRMVETILKVDRKGRRPELADYLEMSEEERLNSGGNGPASDERKERKPGPASDAEKS